MSLARRDWLDTFADPAVVSDLRAAARELMRQVCTHAPEDCDCELNRFTPAEFVDWLEGEVQQQRQRPMRFESGFRPRRMKGEEKPPTWSLAAEG
jgi:hypothetical protein